MQCENRMQKKDVATLLKRWMRFCCSSARRKTGFRFRPSTRMLPDDRFPEFVIGKEKNDEWDRREPPDRAEILHL